MSLGNWEDETSHDAESEELPVTYIVVWPARDGERCRERVLQARWFGISTVFHRHRCLICAVNEKRFSYVLPKVEWWRGFWRRGQPSMFLSTNLPQNWTLCLNAILKFSLLLEIYFPFSSHCCGSVGVRCRTLKFAITIYFCGGFIFCQFT